MLLNVSLITLALALLAAASPVPTTTNRNKFQSVPTLVGGRPPQASGGIPNSKTFVFSPVSTQPASTPSAVQKNPNEIQSVPTLVPGGTPPSGVGKSKKKAAGGRSRKSKSSSPNIQSAPTKARGKKKGLKPAPPATSQLIRPEPQNSIENP